MTSQSINGHSVEELADYRARGRTPRDASIEESPECLRVLDALDHLSQQTEDLLREDTDLSAADSTWLDRILSGLRLAAAPGQRIPLSHSDANADLGIQEGALRGVVRSIGDDMDGVLVGRCRFDGDLKQPGAPITVTVDSAVSYGLPWEVVGESLREAVHDRLREEAELNVVAVDVAIVDVIEPSRAGHMITRRSKRSLGGGANVPAT